MMIANVPPIQLTPSFQVIWLGGRLSTLVAFGFRLRSDRLGIPSYVALNIFSESRSPLIRTSVRPSFF